MRVEFLTEDLLTYDDIQPSVKTGNTDTFAQLFCSKLIKYIFIHKSNVYVIDQEVMIYRMMNRKEGGDSLLKTVISAYLNASVDQIPKTKQEKLMGYDKKAIKNLRGNSFGKDYFDKMLTYLTVQKEQVGSPQLGEIHFNNGYIDCFTGEFKERTYCLHNKNYSKIITTCIDRNYSTPKKKSVNFVHEVLNKIFVGEGDKDYIINEFTTAILGESREDKKCLILYGPGSSGKSTAIEIFEVSADKYYISLPSDSLSINSKSGNKPFVDIYERPWVKIIHIDEPEERKMAGNTFKNLINGKMKVTKLFSDGGHSVDHYGKLVLTANNMVNIVMDSGVERRIGSYCPLSKFVSKDNKDVKLDDSKHIYENDKKLLDKFKQNDDLKNAFIYVIVNYIREEYGDEHVPTPFSFVKATEELTAANDSVKEFIEQCLVIIPEEQANEESKFRIGAQEMVELYNKYFESRKKVINHQQLVMKMREAGIHYNAKLKHNKDRSSYFGVMIKPEHTYNEIMADDDGGMHKLEDFMLLIDQKDHKIKDVVSQNEELIKTIEELKLKLSKYCDTEEFDIVQPKSTTKPKAKLATKTLPDEDDNELIGPPIKKFAAKPASKPVAKPVPKKPVAKPVVIEESESESEEDEDDEDEDEEDDEEEDEEEDDDEDDSDSSLCNAFMKKVGKATLIKSKR